MPPTDYLLDRGLPASLEAERSILGAILLDNDMADEAFAALKADHFFLDAHRRIFQRICDLFETNHPIDIVTLTEQLLKHKELEAVGGAGYLASLTDGVPRRSALTHYIEIVVDKAKLRNLIHAANGIIAQSLEQHDTADQVISEAEESIFNIAAEDDGEAVPIGTLTDAVERRMAEGRNFSNERGALEMTWGISGMDSFTKGLFGGELTVLAGDSGGGKTCTAVQITIANAREGTPCVWFSLDMSRERLTQRFYPSMGDIITANHMRDPRLLNTDKHVPEIQRLSEEIQTLPIWIDETSSIPINKLIARIKAMRRKYGFRMNGKVREAVMVLVVIDYLQLITSKKKDVEKVQEIMFALRDLVKIERNLHILLLSQYSKSDGFSKKRGRSKSDLYGGSVIHHSAQNVVLLTVEDPEKRDENDLLECEFNIAKQRDGRRGKVSCFFDRDHLRCTYAQAVLH